MTCITNIPAGKSNCDKLLLAAKWMIISDPSTVYANVDDFISIYEKSKNLNTPNAKNRLNSHLMEIYSPENTTDDIAVVTLPNTRKIATTKSIPSITTYGVSSFAGSQILLNDLDGGGYKVEFFGQDGILLGTYNPSSFEYSGFDCNITASTKGIPVDADPEKMVQLHIHFSNYNQFKNSTAKSLKWSADDLQEEQPLGLEMISQSKYTFAGGAVDVQINDSNGAGFEDLVTADFVPTDSNKLADIAITATEDALKGGKYSLAITKDAVPVNLAAGDFLSFQVQKKNATVATVVDFISTEVTIQVLS